MNYNEFASGQIKSGSKALVAAAVAGLGIYMGIGSGFNFKIMNYEIPAGVAIGGLVGVSVYSQSSLRDIYLPMIGIDNNVLSTLGRATEPLLTGLSVAALNIVIAKLNGQALGDIITLNSIMYPTLLGAGADIAGDYVDNML